MKRGHFIGIDVHCQFCEIAVLDSAGTVVRRERCDTTIASLLTVLETIPSPRAVVIEEGPLAGWLWRNLRSEVEDMVVSEPRRNRLIAQDGDKDDDLDAEKLAELRRGNFIKTVHQAETLDQVIFKEQVALYNHRVRQRVREGQRIATLFRQHGVMIRERHFAASDDRSALIERLPKHAMLREGVNCLWQSYDASVEYEEQWRRRLIGLAQQEEVVQRFQELPGISWIRGATLYAYLDTPFRFRSKAALWKYMGIGLERRSSGNGPKYLGVPRRAHRLLKSTILSAALSAVTQGTNPFADQHRRWRELGLSPRMARRNVARSMAATLWGLWKNGTAYRPEWVGVVVTGDEVAELSR